MGGHLSKSVEPKQVEPKPNKEIKLHELNKDQLNAMKMLMNGKTTIDDDSLIQSLCQKYTEYVIKNINFIDKCDSSDSTCNSTGKTVVFLWGPQASGKGSILPPYIENNDPENKNRYVKIEYDDYVKYFCKNFIDIDPSRANELCDQEKVKKARSCINKLTDELEEKLLFYSNLNVVVETMGNRHDAVAENVIRMKRLQEQSAISGKPLHIVYLYPYAHHDVLYQRASKRPQASGTRQQFINNSYECFIVFGHIIRYILNNASESFTYNIQIIDNSDIPKGQKNPLTPLLKLLKLSNTKDDATIPTPDAYNQMIKNVKECRDEYIGFLKNIDTCLKKNDNNDINTWRLNVYGNNIDCKIVTDRFLFEPYIHFLHTYGEEGNSSDEIDFRKFIHRINYKTIQDIVNEITNTSDYMIEHISRGYSTNETNIVNFDKIHTAFTNFKYNNPVNPDGVVEGTDFSKNYFSKKYESNSSAPHFDLFMRDRFEIDILKKVSANAKNANANAKNTSGGGGVGKSKLRKQLQSAMKYHVGKHVMNGGSLNTPKEMRSFVKKLLRNNEKLTTKILLHENM